MDLEGHLNSATRNDQSLSVFRVLRTGTGRIGQNPRRIAIGRNWGRLASDPGKLINVQAQNQCIDLIVPFLTCTNLISVSLLLASQNNNLRLIQLPDKAPNNQIELWLKEQHLDSEPIQMNIDRWIRYPIYHYSYSW